MAKQRRVSKRAKVRESLDHLARTSPARLVVLVFAAIILVMTLLLSLPPPATLLLWSMRFLLPPQPFV